MAGNGWTFAVNGWIWVEITAGISWKWLEWLEVAENS